MGSTRCSSGPTRPPFAWTRGRGRGPGTRCQRGRPRGGRSTGSGRLPLRGALRTWRARSSCKRGRGRLGESPAGAACTTSFGGGCLERPTVALGLVPPAGSGGRSGRSGKRGAWPEKIFGSFRAPGPDPVQGLGTSRVARGLGMRRGRKGYGIPRGRASREAGGGRRLALLQRPSDVTLVSLRPVSSHTGRAGGRGQAG